MLRGCCGININLKSLPISRERSKNNIALQMCIHMCIIMHEKKERKSKGEKIEEGREKKRERLYS